MRNKLVACSIALCVLGVIGTRADIGEDTGNNYNYRPADASYTRLEKYYTLWTDYNHVGLIESVTADNHSQSWLYEMSRAEGGGINRNTMQTHKTADTWYGVYTIAGDLTDDQRTAIRNTSVTLYNRGTVTYTWANMIAHVSNPGTYIDPNEVASLRCDGLVEYCYEYNYTSSSDTRVWGPTDTRTESGSHLESEYDVSKVSNLGAHNDFDQFADDPWKATCPRGQRGGNISGNNFNGTSRFTRMRPSDDYYEQNDTRAAAHDLSTRPAEWLYFGRAYQFDEDWYRIRVTDSSYRRVYVQANFTHSKGDIDIQLVDGSGNVLASSTSSTDNEYIDYVVPNTGYYYIRAYYGNRGNSYNIYWDRYEYNPPTTTTTQPTTTTTAPTSSTTTAPTTTTTRPTTTTTAPTTTTTRPTTTTTAPTTTTTRPTTTTTAPTTTTTRPTTTTTAPTTTTTRPTTTTTIPPSDSWDPSDDTANGATRITPNTSVQLHGPHTLSTSDRYDWYVISMTAGCTYEFDTIDGSGDSVGELYRGPGDTYGLVASGDDEGGDMQFAFSYTAVVSQDYYLRVRTWSIGSNWSGYLRYRCSSSPSTLTIRRLVAHVNWDKSKRVSYGYGNMTFVATTATTIDDLRVLSTDMPGFLIFGTTGWSFNTWAGWLEKNTAKMRKYRYVDKSIQATYIIMFALSKNGTLKTTVKAHNMENIGYVCGLSDSTGSGSVNHSIVQIVAQPSGDNVEAAAGTCSCRLNNKAGRKSTLMKKLR